MHQLLRLSQRQLRLTTRGMRATNQAQRLDSTRGEFQALGSDVATLLGE